MKTQRLSTDVSQRGVRVVPPMPSYEFVRTHCPRIWALLNEKAKRRLPKGIEDFVSGEWSADGRTQLQSADARVAALITKTSEATVGDAYRRDFSGVGSEHKLAELLCELTLVAAIAGVSDSQPVFRPATRNGKHCDAKVVLAGRDVYGEVKRLADAWEGGVRSIAKTLHGPKPALASRPRAMDLFSKLEDVPSQFPHSSINILFLFHPSIWNSPVYIKQALFGDASGFDESPNPQVNDDGLFRLSEWREVTACAHSRVNEDGSLSIVQVWRNPNANAVLPEDVLQRIASAGK